MRQPRSAPERFVADDARAGCANLHPARHEDAKNHEPGPPIFTRDELVTNRGLQAARHDLYWVARSVSTEQDVDFRYGLVLFGTLLCGSQSLVLADALNLDFEVMNGPPQVSGLPHWAIHDHRSISLDSTLAFSGHHSMRISLSAPDASARAYQYLPSEVVSGKRLRFSGWIRTAAIAKGAAGPVVSARGPSGEVLIRNDDATFSGTTPWTRWSQDYTMDRSVKDFWFGVGQRGEGTSWFDSLSIEIDGTPYNPPPTPAPRADPSRLLTDEELVPDPDPIAPREKREWVDWVRKNCRPIRSLTEPQFDDLSFLEETIGSRRIVQIGMNGHGVAQFDLVQTRLVRFLHEELGFDVLALEADFYQSWCANKRLFDDPSREVLMSCMGTGRRDEMLPLFEYLRETHQTRRPLILAGTDIKGVWDRPADRGEFLMRAVEAVAPHFSHRVALFERLLREASGGYRKFVRQNPSEWISLYDSLATACEDGMPELRAAFAEDAEAPVVAIQLARNTSVWAQALSADSLYETTRDRGMAGNVEVLLAKLYPRSKLIVIAHNDHVRYANASVARDPMRRMGTWVAERHPSDVYTIGMYMYRGRASFSDGGIYDIRSSEAGTLESVLFNGGRRYLFLDLASAKRGEGTSWIFSPIESYSWGWFRESIVPREQYDGLLFIDTVSPPHYFVN